jgi:transcriptional regulator with XRE-family HTH domain
MGKKKRESSAPRNRIAHLRTQKGWDEKRLADEMDVAYETIRRYENGERDIDHFTIIALARALGVEPYEIIADKELIIAQEFASLSRQRKIIDGYEGLSPDDRLIVDRLMFGKIDASTDGLKKRETA